MLVALCFVVFWGTFFPLISEAVTGDEASVGPPWFDRYVVPLALILVLLSGIGPVIAWRRATLGEPAARLAHPGAAVGAAPCSSLLAAGVGRQPGALTMFGSARSCSAVVGQELCAACARAGRWPASRCRAALVALVRAQPPALRRLRRARGDGRAVRRRRRVVGVPATCATSGCRPGQSADVGGYASSPTTSPTGAIVVARNGAARAIDLGAELEVRRGGEPSTVLHPARSTSRRRRPAGPVSRYFEGESTSEIGLDAGVRRDFWTAVAPDTDRAATAIVKRGDKVFEQAETLPRGRARRLLGEALRRHRRRATATRRRRRTFRMLVSPLVTWIWIGALIVFTGGLICLWPVPRGGAPAGSRAGYAARVARELGRA